ncbi:MAG: LysR family transcriptional regulator [Gallionella sp.]|nr:LysR family transcriptional regulator [Gallionella sp.]
MTLQELRYIVALADAGHFGHAAEICFVGQSTLSTQIKKLEDYLGIAIFDRSLKAVTLTPAGVEIVDSARRIIEEANRIYELSRQTKDPMVRAIHLGVIPTLGPYYLPHVLPSIHEQFPKLRLLLREEMTPHVLAHLTEGKLDAGLLALPLPSEDPALEIVPLFCEPFLAAVPANHPLASGTEIRIGDLMNANLLLLEEGHCLRNQALAACQQTEFDNEEIRATSLETLRQMVSMGLGVTLLPALAGMQSHEFGTRVALRPLAAPSVSRTIGLVWRKRSPIAPTMESLAELLKGLLPPETFGVK